MQTNETLKERIRRQEVITALGLEALSGTDIQRLMDHTVTKLRRVLNVEYAKLLEAMPDKKRFLVRAGIGWDKKIVINKTTVRLAHDSHSGSVFLSRIPKIVHDLRSEKKLQGPSFLRRHNVISSMSCVIWVGSNKPFGILGVHTTKQRSFNKDDINFLQSIANVLAMAILRKETEEELHFKTLLQEAQMEATPDGILVVDKEGKIIAYNRKFTRLWQIPAKLMATGDDMKLIKRVSDNIINPRKFIEKINYVYAHHEEKSKDEIHFKDGKVLERYGRPVIGKKDTYYGYAWYFKDITEQKHSREALRRSERRFKALYNANIIGIVYGETNGVIHGANNAFLSMLGYSRTELKQGKLNWKNINPPEHRVQNKFKVKRMLKKGFIEPFEKEYLHKDGTKIPVLVGAALLDRKMKKEIAFVIDIAERKRLEKQKEDFLGVASHELKTPITSIKAYAQVLETMFRKKGDMTTVSHLMKMDMQINKLTSLIIDLLDVTKVTAGKLRFNRTYFDLNELLFEIIEEVQRTTNGHTIMFDNGPSKVVYGDKERIGQVITNLLTNAIKYSPRTNHILVSSTTSKDTIQVSVQDFGLGIAKNNRPKIFERFYRVERDEHNTYAGLGLGLYISKEIITRHKGKIWFESEKGKGSTFHFTLPLHTDD